jgi:hypothetical protein
MRLAINRKPTETAAITIEIVDATKTPTWALFSMGTGLTMATKT